MIKKSIRDNILNSGAKNIAFAINSEGIVEGSFIRNISKYWPELTNCGENVIGTVLSKEVGDRTFYALVCHSYYDGWGDNQASVMKECFDNIPVVDEVISTIAIGDGFYGKLNGADFRQIVCGMHDSSKEIELYSSYSLDWVLDVYENNKKDNKIMTKRKETV